MPPSKQHVRPRGQAERKLLPSLQLRIRSIRRSFIAFKTFARDRPLPWIFLALAFVAFLFCCTLRNRNADRGSGAALLRLSVAQADIIPKETVFLSGFSSRTESPRSTSLLTSLSPLRVKVLVLGLPEAQSERERSERERSVTRLIIITFDLVGVDKKLSDIIFAALLERYGLKRSQVRLVFSHTHSGPAVGRNLYPLVPDSDVEKAKISRYADFLLHTVLKAVGNALSSENVQLVRAYFGKGSCMIAVNRRQIVERLYEESSGRGDIDPELPVMWFRKVDGPNSIVAGLFGFSAHATVLTNNNAYCGDYPAAVTTALADVYAGSVWFFLPGCGGDLNIYPRGNLSMLIKHRDSIVEEVKQVIANEEGYKPVFLDSQPSFKLRSRHSLVPLRFRKTLSRRELRRMGRSGELVEVRTASTLINSLSAEYRTRATYDFPMSMVSIGRVKFLFLGGEPTVDYASRLRKETGASWVVGYTDDVMGYIGSARVLREGKREGSDRAALYYGLPCAWDVSVEDAIVGQALVLCLDDHTK